MRSIVLAAAAAVAVGAASIQMRPKKELPDRLSTYKDNPFYDPTILRNIGVRLNGVERSNDVVEYDRTEGWAKVQVRDDDGNLLKNKNGTWKTKRIKGVVEPFWKGVAPDLHIETPTLPANHFKSAAEAKRARKAERLKALAAKGAIGVVSA